MNFTKRALEQIQPPESGRATYRDEKVAGLELRVTAAGAKTFAVHRRVNGKPKRITIGRFPEVTIEQARKRATEMLGEIAAGIDPSAARQADRHRTATVESTLAEYLTSRQLKPNTKRAYNDDVRHYLKEWLPRRLASISQQDVIDKHAEISTASEARANGAMRVLRALFNFARVRYLDERGMPLYPTNPVQALSDQRAWNRSRRKQTILMPYDFPAWWGATDELKRDHRAYVRNIGRYLQALLLTGMRSGELAGITTSKGVLDADGIEMPYYNQRAGLIELPDPKGGQPVFIHLRPTTQALIDDALKDAKGSMYPFRPRDSDTPLAERHIADWIAWIEKRCGVRVTRHDLRRTMITVAEGLDISPYTIKRLVGHAVGNDVTGGYIISQRKRMLAALEKIEAEMFRYRQGVFEIE
ncbi:integrase arm-type DNA-binding domain-containing protein [Billgrantia antri]|uniref:Integrase arm-type DNA-binding domain-containing protein n=1 Tax=Halomonas sulfidivorans TaxID=2733488 RepID=A0ABX7WLY1_9GAMM|nr:integrase arm-type DNA-binding domain-containing protein [Halomonas sulfidivorans]QTP60946.1 integrase arm-type DNA-binding domain-containing protein [Halomonas sulfidivorans]